MLSSLKVSSPWARRFELNYQVNWNQQKIWEVSRFYKRMRRFQLQMKCLYLPSSFFVKNRKYQCRYLKWNLGFKPYKFCKLRKWWYFQALRAYTSKHVQQKIWGRNKRTPWRDFGTNIKETKVSVREKSKGVTVQRDVLEILVTTPDDDKLVTDVA